MTDPSVPRDGSPWALRAPGEGAPIALGTMNFGKRTDAATADRIVKRALDLGVRVFDTANVYVDGESERILGRALGRRRGEVTVATKVGFGRIAGRPEGLAPARVLAAIDESLGRLGTDHVDVYYLHVPDPAVPIAETLDAVAEIVRSGKASAFGVSNFASWQIVEIVQVCERIGLARPVVAQQIHNLLIRQLDVEYFRFAAAYALHTTVYNPLAGGLLSGRYREGDAVVKGSRFDKNRLYQSRYWSPRMLAHATEYAELAARFELTPVELAYAWLAGAPGVDSILAGPATEEHLVQAVHGAALALPDAARAEVETLHRAFVGTDTTYAR